MYDQFEIALEENAMDSLVHAIEHYRNYTVDYKSRDLKYTVLHAFNAVELYLKARVAKEHPLLVYDRPEDAKRRRTANFDQLIGRLENAGVDLKSHRPSLDSLREVRNEIEHHRVDTSISNVETYTGKAIHFLETFLRSEFSVELRDELEDRLLDGDEAYKKIVERLYGYSERLDIATRQVDHDEKAGGPEVSRLYCYSCGEFSLLYPDPRSKDGFDRCYFCDEIAHIRHCELCNGLIQDDGTPSAESDYFNYAYCEDCQDRLFERY